MSKKNLAQRLEVWGSFIVVVCFLAVSLLIMKGNELMEKYKKWKQKFQS